MLGNLKELISVVQEGLTSTTSLRQSFQDVRGVTSMFKDKLNTSGENKVIYGAGGALLEKYQEDWVAIHDNAEKSAKAAEEVDKLITEIDDIVKKKLQSAQELSQNLASIPALTAKVAETIDALKTVNEMLTTTEQELLDFEDIVERSKMENWKLDHHYQLTVYKEKKMAALESVRNQLATEKIYEREKQQLAELQVKRETSAAAFQNDVAKFLASGSVGKAPPFSPNSLNITLDQIQLDEDQGDLEQFLSSS